MSAKERAMAELPPMFPRVVAADELASAQRRARFFAEMEELYASGVVRQVMTLIRSERGTWLREGHTWPKWVRAIAESEFHRASLLEELVRECHVTCASLQVGGKEQIGEAMEARALDLLQQLLEVVFEEARHVHSRNAEAMAGLAGPIPVGLNLRASSGVEAAGNLAWCVQRAVRGIENPFWPYIVSARSKRVMRKQRGRDQARSAEELHPDDLAILRACGSASLSAKEVANCSDACGFKMTASHASKRKGDLEDWGLLKDVPKFELSQKGQQWLWAVEDRQNTRR